MDIDYDKIVKDTEELTERRRKGRIERGLPPEPPEDFLPLSIASVLAEGIPDFIPAIVKYAKFVNDSGRLVAVDTSKFEAHFEDLKLISYTKCWDPNPGAYAAFNLNALRLIKTISDTISNGEEYTEKTPEGVVRHLYGDVKILQLIGRPRYTQAYRVTLDIPYREQIAEAKAEYELYKSDEALFNVELEKYRQHYESIKHLLQG